MVPQNSEEKKLYSTVLLFVNDEVWEWGSVSWLIWASHWAISKKYKW